MAYCYILLYFGPFSRDAVIMIKNTIAEKKMYYMRALTTAVATVAKRRIVFRDVRGRTNASTVSFSRRRRHPTVQTNNLSRDLSFNYYNLCTERSEYRTTCDIYVYTKMATIIIYNDITE